MDLALPGPPLVAVPSLTRRRVLLARGGRWDPHEVAAHLLDRRGRVVGALSREHPWSGLNDDVLEGLWSEAVATITTLASSGSRPGWRRPRDLERAAIAAFRNVALTHHRAARAIKRTADREALPFVGELHGAVEPGLSRLFADPREHVVAEDWLVELQPGPLRDLWRDVLVHERSFKDAGEGLDLGKADVTRLVRDGRRQLARFAELHRRGLVCAYRRSSLEAVAASTASGDERERAAAHVAACLPCALVFEPGASATDRGLVSVFPLAFVLRVRDFLVERGAAVADVGVAKAGGAVLATAVAAGTATHATRRDHPPAATATRTTRTIAPATSAVAAHAPTQPRTIPVTATPASAPAPAAVVRHAKKKRATSKKRRATTAKSAAPARQPASAAPPPAELSFEQPRPRTTSPAPADQADAEFSRP